jgi:phosphoglycerate dehydrogenase-like enzyme
MKIYYLAKNLKLPYWFKKSLKKLGEVRYLSFNENDDYINKGIQKAEILIVHPIIYKKISFNFLKSLPRLKYIVLMSKGYDFLDPKITTDLGIKISNCGAANSEAVAEYTWTMILILARKLYLLIKDGFCKTLFSQNFEGLELFNKTIGILGTGDIGTKVARIAKGFNMRILGYNKSFKKPKYFDQIVDLKTLLKVSDIISINLPLNENTKGLINEEKIFLVKKGVIIVNSSREEIVDKKAIVRGINEKKIGGYAFDLNINNNLIKKDNFFKYKNVVFTPHIGYNTKEAKEKMLREVIKNIKNFILGKPINIIEL